MQPEIDAEDWDNIIIVPPFLQFNLCIPETPRKTEIWEVYGRRNHALLGQVRWNYRWRQYCFFPANDTLFNRTCLESIAWFCGERNHAHAAELRARRA
jgi:hypothetical protein